ncbi:MAG: sel1 repeat family protein [Verrucomicrobia bacterium]|nr:sel1 repeat family protein [Verrucomicrobiota bacterium]
MQFKFKAWGMLGMALWTLPLLLATEPTSVDAGKQRQIDDVFDIKHDLILIRKGKAAAFAFVEKEFAHDPRPHIKARYGEDLMNGKYAGAPDGRADEGRTLLNEAHDAGSLFASRAIGWILLDPRTSEFNADIGINYMTAAADAGYADAMVYLGKTYQFGRGLPVDSDAAETWFLRAARLGNPWPLFTLGENFEKGTRPQPLNLEKAAEIYYQAAIYGSAEAAGRLKELAGRTDAIPAIKRSHQLVVLWYASLGASYQTPIVKMAANELEAAYPEDPVVLGALGRMYASGFCGFRDFPKAFALLSKAAGLGSDDARAERATLLAEGMGTKKDPAKAAAEWHALETKGNAEALAALGYYHYWGALKDAGLTQDAALTYQDSKRAADSGNYFGQRNTGACYEFGIGVEMNYALAAHYYMAGAQRGDKRSRDKLPKVLAHALD